MSIFSTVVLNKKIPTHPDYVQNVKDGEFFEEATEVSSDYFEVPDTKGNDALRRFTCEDSSDYLFRKNIANPKNFCGGILNKYLNTSFKEKPVRNDNEFYKNVDTLGSTMDELMQQAAKEALVYGVSYLLPDSNSNEENLSQAQQRLMGVRPFIRLIQCNRVVNWNDIQSHLSEALVEFESEEGNIYFIYYDTVNYARIDVNDKFVVTAIGDLIPHNYSSIPLVRVLPFDTDESFIAAGANLQLNIANLDSLLSVEIYKATFSKYFASGISLPTDAEGNTVPLTWGVNRIMVSPAADSKMTVIGADTAQADSIRKSIQDEITSLYKMYHLSASSIGEITEVPSGISLIISREDFNAACNSIVKAVEQAEAQLVILLNESENLGLENVIYPREFIQPDQSEDLAKLRDILSIDLPEEAKAIAKQKFIEKYLQK